MAPHTAHNRTAQIAANKNTAKASVSAVAQAGSCADVSGETGWRWGRVKRWKCDDITHMVPMLTHDLMSYSEQMDVSTVQSTSITCTSGSCSKCWASCGRRIVEGRGKRGSSQPAAPIRGQ